jgi:phage shock protein A
MQISTDPKYLRDRAKQAEAAGDENLANTLNAEADELESETAPAEGAP